MLRFGEGVALGVAAHMVDERAAAALALRQHHLDAVPVEEPDGGVVEARLQHRLRAARQEGDAPAPRSLRREHARMGEGRARRQARGREIEHGARGAGRRAAAPPTSALNGLPTLAARIAARKRAG